ncbi:hypothetical protein TMUPMC115_0602 [Tetragenococcus muriaticus PMC-11-5]|uniref:Uncharacterized protein n=1 Tax=Tetragenococcus muriaticus PMC-11-5 TaxID=1302649 RepID=A0A091C5J5_9ENTE|nr:hypothetical protein TMUPMC115_0602 [Tetragenococcus muriaticus PMC-11-5]
MIKNRKGFSAMQLDQEKVRTLGQRQMIMILKKNYLLL